MITRIKYGVLRNQCIRTFDKGGASPRANAVSINHNFGDMRTVQPLKNSFKNVIIKQSLQNHQILELEPTVFEPINLEPTSEK